MPRTDVPGEYADATSTFVDDDFVRQVRDALADLYDLPRLQTHPLTTHVRAEPGARAATVGKTLQACLLAAIATLRPTSDLAGTERAARIHRLLELRYVEALKPPAVWARLGIGKSEYHRSFHQGVVAVASSRWRACREQPSQAADELRRAGARDRRGPPAAGWGSPGDADRTAGDG
jgi:hypothetical protein